MPMGRDQTTGTVSDSEVCVMPALHSNNRTEVGLVETQSSGFLFTEKLILSLYSLKPISSSCTYLHKFWNNELST